MTPRTEVPLVRSARTTHHPSVVSCDNITTVRGDAVHDTIGLFFDDQEPDLALAISDAFELVLL